MNNTSNWTGKTNRTLTEAFGAHTSQQILEPDRPYDKEDLIVLTFCGIITVGVFLFALFF